MLSRLLTRRNLVIGTTVIAITLFGILVWPTQYRYDRSAFGGGECLIRINRFTGRTEVLFAGSWINMDAPKHGEEIPAKAISQLQVKFLLPNGGLKVQQKRVVWDDEIGGPGASGIAIANSGPDLAAEVFNDSDWRLDALSVNLSVVGENDKPARRDHQYVLRRTTGTGMPGTTSRYEASDNLEIAVGDQFSAVLVGATGTKQ